MLEKTERCVQKLIKEGKEEGSAWAICKSSLDATNKFKYEICPDSGFMRAIGICARSGIQEYLGYELGLTGEKANQVFNVYRPKDEVVASLSSYNGAIVTDEHPNGGLVVTEDAKELTKGNTSEAYGFERDEIYYVVAKTTITDPELIQKIEEGKRELSAGYTRDLVEESGEHNGTPYQFVQRNIKANHVAVVQEGRCGNACKINLDKKEVKMDGIKIQMDGKTVTMDTVEAIKYIGELKTQRDEAIAEVEKTKESMDATVEELQAAIEAKTAELEELKKQLEEMVTPEEAAEMAEESIEIDKDAKELGVEVTEKSNDAKMKQILGAISDKKHSVDSISGDALKTVYRISVDAAKKAKEAQANGYNGTQADGKVIPRTGDYTNDLNAIAKAARQNRGAK